MGEIVCCGGGGGGGGEGICMGAEVRSHARIQYP